MKQEKIHQVCLSDARETWQNDIDNIRDSILKNRPEGITDDELWNIQKKRGTSGVLKFLIRLGREKFVT